MGKHQHPGWTHRIKLDPVQAAAQGGEYVQAVGQVLRDLLLHGWADDPANAVWHPGPEFRLRLDESYELDQRETWLVGEISAVYRPDDVPAEVLDHVHAHDCEHVLVPFVTTQVCDTCGNQYAGFRLCPKRCTATFYAVARFLESYPPPPWSIP